MDPSGLDAYLDIVVGTNDPGGTFNYYGHAWIEVSPIPGTGSAWNELSSYATYPKGLVKNDDLTIGYRDDVNRTRRRIRLDSSQEASLQKYLQEFGKKPKEEKWQPWSACDTFATNAWNEVAPDDEWIDPSQTVERVDPTKLDGSGAAPDFMFKLKWHTPRRLGQYLESR
ncbi:MAG: hypothetical protein WC314_23265 [Vulcanimicrobiota bacterium]